MLQSYCALPRNNALELCTATPGSRKRLGDDGHARALHGEPSSKGRHAEIRQLRKKGNRRRGIATLWTAEALATLRAWWCADRRHVREPRCARGVRWTRQQPGLSAMRRLFCDQRAANEAGGANVARLCLGVAGHTAAGGTSSATVASAGSLSWSQDGDDGRGRRQRMLHPYTVAKIMVCLLCGAALLGWGLSRWCSRRQRRPRLEAVQAADELGEVVGSSAAARRRPAHSKRRWRGDSSV
jgi:hypothetical protein